MAISCLGQDAELPKDPIQMDQRHRGAAGEYSGQPCLAATTVTYDGPSSFFAIQRHVEGGTYEARSLELL